MPQRLSFSLLALVWLLTNLFSVSITNRDAYALIISNIETTDFWLDFPSGKNAENEYITNDLNEYITNDFEVTDWLLTNLDEMEAKEVPSPDNISISEIDSFDPFQITVKIFSSNLLIFPSILIILLLFTCTGLVFLNSSTFQTVFHNCFRSDKSISWRRIKREIGRFSQFVLSILIIIVFYIALSVTLLALYPQGIPWNNQYGWLALLLYFGVTFYFSVFKLSLGIFKGYKNRVIRRSDYYHWIDLDRLNKKTLDTG